MTADTAEGTAGNSCTAGAYSTGTEGLTECMEDLLTQTWSYSAKQSPAFFSKL